jgi:hypothetical protein
MVDILCGVLSGSAYGPHVRTWQTSNAEANLVISLTIYFIIIQNLN